MLGKEKRLLWVIVSMLWVTTFFFSGCATHLEKGWKMFSENKYSEAKTEWEQEEKEDLTVPIAKAVAALKIVDSYQQAIAAKEAGKNQDMVDYSREVVAQDRWDDKDWLKQSPVLQERIDEAHLMIEAGYANILTRFKDNALAAQKEKNYQKMLRYAIAMVEKETEESKVWIDKYPSLRQLINDGHQLIEEAYFGILSDHNKEGYWVDTKQEYKAYLEYTKQYNQPVSKRIRDLNARAEAELEKRKKVLAEYDANLECAKQQFLSEEYDKAMSCIVEAEGLVSKYKDVKFNTDDLDYVKQSTEQAIEIQKQMEAEKQRLAEAERLRIEEANRRAAEAERKLEEERRRQETEKIKLARAAERERLRKLEEERRAEAERQRQIEERNRRWRAFLAKGAPLKPLVTTVLKPSVGTGTLAKGEKQKWQGGSQLPKPKDKSIQAEDVYALEVEVPKTHQLTYLRNYYNKSKREENRLSPPKTQGGKRSYYTENFKGGRYYVEVENEKSNEKKYEIKARIYKIPVTF